MSAIIIGLGFFVTLALIASEIKSNGDLELPHILLFFVCGISVTAVGVFFVSSIPNVFEDMEEFSDKQCCTHPDESYGTGPGAGSNSSGYHTVDGYYRSDGTYVDSYIRSNPDGNPYNNINP